MKAEERQPILNGRKTEDNRPLKSLHRREGLTTVSGFENRKGEAGTEHVWNRAVEVQRTTPKPALSDTDSGLREGAARFLEHVFVILSPCFTPWKTWGKAHKGPPEGRSHRGRKAADGEEEA